ncbi:hypothetical protein [Sphaerospermopsis sp. LEGE 08334]|jgi:hypothetical protein|uniref:hypothetical protein n=1 Tax=Sphaerospermopsis sp. LEGE 08334 TaxID=1828651 RepID=UPI001881FF55|nr:hypothetical protein [Sphaerospermopsis sp. LEGE 08334]MBE9058947.1 hypothetical protein [Sphaerospermopsis sp. LEGE 08334]
MTIKELIIAEIDQLPEENLYYLYQIIQELRKINHNQITASISINRSFLDQQYQIITEKITKQFDSEWLNTLETEDDILEAAVELTKHTSEKKGILSKLKEIKIQAPEDFYINSVSHSYHDLDYLAGTWEEEDETEFLANTQQFNEIDNNI